MCPHRNQPSGCGGDPHLAVMFGLRMASELFEAGAGATGGSRSPARQYRTVPELAGNGLKTSCCNGEDETKGLFAKAPVPYMPLDQFWVLLPFSVGVCG